MCSLKPHLLRASNTVVPTKIVRELATVLNFSFSSSNGSNLTLKRTCVIVFGQPFPKRLQILKLCQVKTTCTHFSNRFICSVIFSASFL